MFYVSWIPKESLRKKRHAGKWSLPRGAMATAGAGSVARPEYERTARVPAGNLGSGRLVASEIEAPNMLVNLV
jgi:hypothetical protein